VAKHRLQRESRVSAPVRGAIVLGAVTAGTVAVPAAPAMAATINVPGFGDIAVPDLPQIEIPQVQLPQLPQLPAFVPPPAFAPPVVAPPVVQQTIGERALDAARTKVGAQYVWGATGPNSFDCSGLVQWAYKQAGVSIPRTSFEQANVGSPVSVSELRPGDIVITNGGNHASVYAGDGQIVEASTSGVPVKYSPLSQYSVYTARRV
jgi:peptidoglycan DL-endopeptidase CwlO